MRSLVTVFAIILVCTARTGAAAQAFDVLIRNGHLMDGTGSPWYSGDIGIRNGRIAALGRLHDATAKTTIDAKNLLVTPGFIDMLAQSEMTILVEPHLPSKIFQGITTEVTGEGNSVAPISERTIQADRLGSEHLTTNPDWRTLSQYFPRLERQGMGINLATFLGPTSVRRGVIRGDD